MYDYYGNLVNEIHHYDYTEDIAASRFFWSTEDIGELWYAETIEAACWAMEDLDADGVVSY